MTELLEINETLEALNGELQDLMVRGLRVCGPEHLVSLKSMDEHLSGVGARHLAERLQKLIAAIEADSSNAAAELLGAFATLRVFERVLTLKFAGQILQSSLNELQSSDTDASELGDEEES